MVTGGAGFMGAHVTRELLNSGHDVVVVDDLSGGFERNVDPRASLVCADVCDCQRMSLLFKEHGFEYIFHLAAYAAEGLSHFIKRFNYNNNLIGSVNLINEAVKHNAKCFVFTSSIAVYGTNRTPMTEDLAPQPEDPYGIAKYAVEMELEVTRKMFGLQYIVFRPHNVYGEFQNMGDKYRNVIGIFMNQLMQGQPMTIFGDGEQTRAFSYIAGVSEVIARSISEPKAYNQVFNIGGDNVYTVNHLAKAIAMAMGCEAKIKHLDARHEVKHAFCNHSKVKEYFSVKDEVPLEEGLRRMAEWAKTIGSCKSKPFENIEVEKNMPPSWRI
ncbi:MAG TPA: NAD-dependent epimerase/dehydratase family protein [Candidatus Brocadiaceae bacterium]